MKEFFISQIKGRMASYVARETEPLDKLVKYIKTMCERYGVTSQELQRILNEIRSESVDPFLEPSKGILYQPGRLARFENLSRIQLK